MLHFIVFFQSIQNLVTVFKNIKADVPRLVGIAFLYLTIDTVNKPIKIKETGTASHMSVCVCVGACVYVCVYERSSKKEERLCHLKSNVGCNFHNVRHFCN